MRKVLWLGLACLLLALGFAVAQEATPAPAPAAPNALPPIEAYLQIKQAVDGRWLADGKSVVYKTNVSGTMQVWKIDAAGGPPTQLTAFDDPIDALAPSPADPNLVLFAKAVGGNERTQLFVMDAAGKNVERLTRNDEAIFHFGVWSRDGKRFAFASNQRDAAFFDVYVYDLGAREAKLVMQKDAALEAVAFSPSGELLVVSESDATFNNNLYLLYLRQPKTKPQLLTEHKGWATYDPVRWPIGPDSAKGFYVVTNLSKEFKKIAFLNIDRDALEFHDHRMWDTERLTFSRNGVTMAYADNSQGWSRVGVVDVLADKIVEPPPIPKCVIFDIALSPKGDKLLYAAADPRTPADLYVADIKTGAVMRLTASSLGALAGETFVEPTAIAFPTTDSRVEPAFLYLPRELAEHGKAPCIVSLHGGPEEQERPIFNPLYQYFLRRGYAILAPNIRGSSGYGKVYEHLDDVEKRPDAVRDVADAADYLRKYVPRIDADRLAVFGGSYGGYLTLAALTEYPDRFAAGVCIAGIANFETFLEKTGPWRRKNREAEYGSLEKNRDLLRRLSPIHRLDKLRAPLLLIYGKNDPRVPLDEAEQIAAAAKQRGLPVELLVYADEGHGLRKLKNRLDAYPKIAAFFDRWLKAPAAEASPQPAAN